MKGFLFGLIVGVLLVPAAGFLYLSSGSAPVATSEKPLPFERMLARRALHARMDKEMPQTVPIQPDEANLKTGAQIYRENCAVCHGLPGGSTSTIAKGMFPKVPQLFSGHGVTDDPPGETYWKVENGIRLSGMPGFRGNLSDTQMWQVSLLLANADKVPESVKTILASAQTQPN